MSRLPINLGPVLAALGHPMPVAVRDSGGGAYLGGRWTPEPETLRQIRAVVLQMRQQELEILGHGQISGGGIVLHTKAELYFADVTGDGRQAQTRQSYVDYQGYAFKVVGSGFMLGNTNINTYQALRYDAR